MDLFTRGGIKDLFRFWDRCDKDLTCFSWKSPKRVIGKQCKPRSDKADWHLIRIYAVCINYRNFYKHSNNKINKTCFCWKWTGPDSCGRRVHLR